MNKADLSYAIADRTGITKAQAASVLEELAAVAEHELNAGSDFVLPGIGRFFGRFQEARTGRNPGTGEAVDIPAKTVVKFKVAPALAKAVA